MRRIFLLGGLAVLVTATLVTLRLTVAAHHADTAALHQHLQGMGKR
jgi:hypothetical protein